MSSAAGYSARLKITSIGCAVLILILRALYVPNTLRLHPLFLWFISAGLVTVLLPTAIWLVVARPERRPRPAFGIDSAGPRFVAGPRPVQRLYGMLLFVFATMVPPVERVPNTDRMRWSTVPGITEMAAILFGITVALGLTLILLDRPRLDLDADGMTLVRLIGRRRIAWDDIAPRSAMLQPRGGSSHRIVWQGRHSLPTYALHVDRVFLLHAVRIYTDQPDRRAEIGTRAGLDRLQRERSDALATAGLMTVPLGNAQ